MDSEFKELLKRLRTPHKQDHLVLAPSYKKGAYDSHLVDCPFLFEYEGRFYMTHVGWDGIGYRTGLASSNDLIHWQKEGVIIDRGTKGSVTEFNVALTWIVRDNDLLGKGHLKKINGSFLGTYHSYPRPGYESGPASIGLGWSQDLRHWELEKPFLHPSEGSDWEQGGLYKSCLVEHNGTYFMFYNAKNKTEGGWNEQIGLVTSSDLKNWVRFEGNPVLTLGKPGVFDDRFASDPCVFKCGNIWVMFYFGLCSDGHARDSVAFSRDLRHWEKSNEILIDVGPEGSIDSRYAHKPGMFFQNGKLYHFYCAVAPSLNRRMGEIEYNEIRGIGLATS